MNQLLDESLQYRKKERKKKSFLRDRKVHEASTTTTPVDYHTHDNTPLVVHTRVCGDISCHYHHAVLLLWCDKLMLMMMMMNSAHVSV